jgi:hypothetical protein
MLTVHSALAYIWLNIFPVRVMYLPCEQERKEKRGVESKKIRFFQVELYAETDN